MMPPLEKLVAFIRESNKIEGIIRDPSAAEVEVSWAFLELPRVTVPDMCRLVHVYAPGAELRERVGMNVTVGKHVPPRGSALMRARLADVLGKAKLPLSSAYHTHLDYENLHPFMDGNGRSGRMLWAWQMCRGSTTTGLDLGFLHRFYYQTLAHQETR